MKVAYLWTNISGYMAACWRDLNSKQDVEVSVCAYQPSSAAPFSVDLLDGLNSRVLDAEERKSFSAWKQFVETANADVYVICGWANPTFVSIASYIKSRGARVVVVLDTPFEGRWHQYLTRFRYRKLFANTDLFVVTGERSYQYALRLGRSVPIRRGLYGVEFNKLKSAYDKRVQASWPKSFLFVGRYAEVKNVDVLLEAYANYRTQVPDPWPLKCCGTGPQAALLDDVPGVEDRGFCQPSELVDIMAESGAFVLASRFDPWPLVIVEACASGLPILCSQACGSAVENVREYYNGIQVQTGSVQELIAGFLEMHNQYEELPHWGRRSQEMAAAYSSEAWANRWSVWLRNLIQG